jgi:hypothetical protein
MTYPTSRLLGKTVRHRLGGKKWVVVSAKEDTLTVRRPHPRFSDEWRERTLSAWEIEVVQPTDWTYMLLMGVFWGCVAATSTVSLVAMHHAVVGFLNL